MPDSEKMVMCPYNAAHVILQSRMPKHLIKCRAAHPGTLMEACPFDTTHMVPAPEMKYHVDNCSHRSRLDTHLYSIGHSAERKSGPDLMNIELPEFSEDWDAQPGPTNSYLDQKEEIIANKPVLRQKNGLSKAQKRDFHLNERLRMNNLTDPTPSTAACVDNFYEPKIQNNVPRMGIGRGKIIQSKFNEAGGCDRNFNTPSTDKADMLGSKLENLKLTNKWDAGDASSGLDSTFDHRSKYFSSNDSDDESGFQMVCSSRGRGRKKK